MFMNLFAPLAGGLSQLAAAQEEAELFGDEAEGLLSTLGTTPFWPVWSSIWEMIFRLLINVVTIGIIVHAFYYPKAKRRDYYFTFSIIGVSIFTTVTAQIIVLLEELPESNTVSIGSKLDFRVVARNINQVVCQSVAIKVVAVGVAPARG